MSKIREEISINRLPCYLCNENFNLQLFFENNGLESHFRQRHKGLKIDRSKCCVLRDALHLKELSNAFLSMDNLKENVSF